MPPPCPARCRRRAMVRWPSLQTLLVVATLLVGPTGAAPFSPLDVFRPACPPLTDPDPTGAKGYQGYQLWSSPSTWPGRAVPRVGANVTIPCGQAVLLDVPAITLGLLRVQGLLRFKDDPSLPNIYVKANYVLVEGQLSIGAPDKHYSQMATIELTPHSTRANLLYTFNAPADPQNGRNLGHKVFAVVGGQVRLHGMPGGSNTPSWCRLNQTAQTGAASIIVDDPLAIQWPVGGEIVVASSDYNMRQAEEFKITRVSQAANGVLVRLNATFQFSHFGDPLGVPDGFGGYVDERAEVALLTRTIRITGTDEVSPNELEGGHFIVFHTRTVQFIEGVEYYKMGQQGRLGRYPIHFHVVRSVPDNLCRNNVVRESKQRCVVLHTTDDMTVEGTVAYKTKGHCYITEEGAERNNTFKRNLGLLTEKVTKLISRDESDNFPTTFWMTSATNNLIDNVAAGSEDTGIWIELHEAVRGITAQIPELKNINPQQQSLGIFKNNVAHSNRLGLRTYPKGMKPKSGKAGVMEGLKLYKHTLQGANVVFTQGLTFNNSVFTDNGLSLAFAHSSDCEVANSRLIGLSGNYGNPKNCRKMDGGECRPISGCTMPLADPSLGRSTGGLSNKSPIYGIKFQLADGTGAPYRISNTKFSNFDSTCWTSTALMVLGNESTANAGNNVQGLQFDAVSQRVWFPPRVARTSQYGGIENWSEQSMFYSLRELDSSISGAGPGYIVANTPALLPPSPHNCTFNSKWNAYSCPNRCYRTLTIRYPEDALAGKNEPGDLSSLQVTRSDGKVFTVNGNMPVTSKYVEISRGFAMTLLADMTYQIKIVPGEYLPDFFPNEIEVQYADGDGCGQGLVLQILPKDGKMWQPISTDSFSYSPCPGGPPAKATAALYSVQCIGGQPWGQLDLHADFADTATLSIANVTTSECPMRNQCSLQWSGDMWKYDTTTTNFLPSFYNPALDDSSWPQGVAPLGWSGDDDIRTSLPTASSDRLSYEFRHTFTLRDSRCFTALQIQMSVRDGSVVYLNNVELLRANMPSGPLTANTRALGYGPSWVTLDVPLTGAVAFALVEGTNYIAVDQRVAQPRANKLMFDMRIIGQRNASCGGALIRPEICDGVDNNNDGLVDKDASGKPLTQPCGAKCGSGVSSCINGFFQQCTAGDPTPEVCNGVDDDCDGLVDNGAGQLDCTAGQVCFQGRCLAVRSATEGRQVWPRNATGWAYFDTGDNVDALYPDWRKGQDIDAWKTGRGPLGVNTANPPWDAYGTRLVRFQTTGKGLTAYFAKPFTLTQADLNTTFAMNFNIRRVDGAVIYLNGVELWRTNMRPGPVTYTTPASAMPRSSGCCDMQWTYTPCGNCLRSARDVLKVGTNWIAVELHAYARNTRVSSFDMDLFRQAFISCSSLPGSPSACVRSLQQQLILPKAVWTFSDADLPLPSSNWKTLDFDASSWKSGMAPLGRGYNRPPQNTEVKPGPSLNDPQRTYYFRQVFDVPDGACFYQFVGGLLVRDGAVVYINGVEARRVRLPNGTITANTTATILGSSAYEPFTLSGGWLRNGRNVLAVEVHRRGGNNGNLNFDLELSGSKEAVACSPAPSRKIR